MHRQELLKLKNLTVIDDTYNASPDSMKASLSILKDFDAKRKVAVLADMKELGVDEIKLHKEIGEFILKNLKLDAVFSVGDLAKEITGRLNTFNKSFENNEELESYLLEYLQEGDVCLLKGSNSMRLFDVVDKIKNYEKFIR